MFELALLIGLAGALLLMAVFFKIVFAILVWPLKVTFLVVAGIFQLILLPFQFLGGIVFAILFLPLLLLGTVLLVGVGVPLLAILGIGLAVWIVGGILALLGGLLFGGC
jgi:hypothetical protein